VVGSRGQQCGDIELGGYLPNLTGPVFLVLDLRITHECFGSRSDISINRHLHYPNDIDRSLNEVATDKIRKYLTDNNNNPPSTISFIPVIPSTSGRLHSEFVRLLFLQAHRETDHFFCIFRSSAYSFYQCPVPLCHDLTLTLRTCKPLVY
jgi:hypothetical protein